MQWSFKLDRQRVNFVENRGLDGTRAAMNKQRIILFSMGKVLKNIRGTLFFLYKKIISAESVTDLVSTQW
jgi:hypothetical protein